MKPGWYWASRAGTTPDKEDRQIVQIELHMGETTLWRIAQEHADEISDWKDFTPVACEESAAAWEACDKHEWPYNLSEEDAELIETAIAKNREAREANV